MATPWLQSRLVYLTTRVAAFGEGIGYSILPFGNRNAGRDRVGRRAVAMVRLFNFGGRLTLHFCLQPPWALPVWRCSKTASPT